jgi:lactoylglutathione lyase
VITKHWAPDGRIRWCWLEIGEAAVMLQEFWKDGRHAGAPEGPCSDAIAIYRSAIARGLTASRPFVSNGMWLTALTDPDGYRLDFESATDAEEETTLE